MVDTQNEKENILKDLNILQRKINLLDENTFQEQKKDLDVHVKNVRKNTEKVLTSYNEAFQQIQDLKDEVKHLQHEIEELTSKNEALADILAMAEATWVWEAHLARFVVSPNEPIALTRRFHQMKEYVRKSRDRSRWNTIQDMIGEWTGLHWEMVNAVRELRRPIAHPGNLDLQSIEKLIPRLEKNHQEPMRNMLDILKTTASLMKFGRLAAFYNTNKNDFPATLELGGEDALRVTISWDRNFEEIDGLQNIEHEEAKNYLTAYLGRDRGTINHCINIADFIKDGNSIRLGKLASEFAKHYRFIDRMSMEEKEAASQLKKLLPLHGERHVSPLDNPTIAKLHIPDFLPKHLWSQGMKIVDIFFKLSIKK